MLLGCKYQMEEPKERPNEPKMSDNTDIAKKLYQVLSLNQTSIIQEIYRCKTDEIRINNDVKNVEKDLGVVDHELLPRCRFLTFNNKKRLINVGTDKKSCHNRLNKERMDLEYSKQVQEELLISKKSDKMPIDGAQELNYVMESLIHRIQHGNNKRADEVKLYHEIRNVKDTIEIYTEPTEPDDGPDPWQRRPNLDKRHKQRQLKKSSYTEYQSLMTYVRKLVQRGDIEYQELMTYLKAAANSE
ncbi:hypothetical protein Tco_1099738 [Tanacetum coccineum]